MQAFLSNKLREGNVRFYRHHYYDYSTSDNFKLHFIVSLAALLCWSGLYASFFPLQRTLYCISMFCYGIWFSPFLCQFLYHVLFAQSKLCCFVGYQTSMVYVVVYLLGIDCMRFSCMFWEECSIVVHENHKSIILLYLCISAHRFFYLFSFDFGLSLIEHCPWMEMC